MSNPFKTKKFEDLKDKWYKKLEKSGFKDIEQDEDNLKEWESFAFCGRYQKSLFQSKEAYFQMAGQFLHTYKFKNERDRFIWECHADGKTITQIAEALKKRRFKIHNRTGAHLDVLRLSKEMLKANGIDTDDKQKRPHLS